MFCNEKVRNVVEDVVLPGTGISPSKFWSSFQEIVTQLGPKNRLLLEQRDTLQATIDVRYQHGAPVDETFLRSIGYQLEAPTAQEAAVATSNVDPEISAVSAPQLVVPIDNARFLLNASNARWGSLLDALYGTDTVPGERAGAYNDTRGALVFDRAHEVESLFFQEFCLQMGT